MARPGERVNLGALLLMRHTVQTRLTRAIEQAKRLAVRNDELTDMIGNERERVRAELAVADELEASTGGAS